jgi:hypothetical protein
VWQVKLDGFRIKTLLVVDIVDLVVEIAPTIEQVFQLPYERLDLMPGAQSLESTHFLRHSGP